MFPQTKLAQGKGCASGEEKTLAGNERRMGETGWKKARRKNRATFRENRPSCVFPLFTLRAISKFVFLCCFTLSDDIVCTCWNVNSAMLIVSRVNRFDEPILLSIFMVRFSTIGYRDFLRSIMLRTLNIDNNVKGNIDRANAPQHCGSTTSLYVSFIWKYRRIKDVINSEFSVDSL